MKSILFIIILYHLSMAFAHEKRTYDLIYNNKIINKFSNCHDSPLKLGVCAPSQCFVDTNMGVVLKRVEGFEGNECLYREQIINIGGIECHVPYSELKIFADLINILYINKQLLNEKFYNSPITRFCTTAQMDKFTKLVSLKSNMEKLIGKNEIYNPDKKKDNVLSNITVNKTLPNVLQSSFNNKPIAAKYNNKICVNKIIYANEDNWLVNINGVNYTTKQESQEFEFIKVKEGNVTLAMKKEQIGRQVTLHFFECYDIDRNFISKTANLD